MDKITKTDLEELVSQTGGVKISIYFNTHQRGQNIRKNSIKLKNHIKKVENLLEKDNLTSKEINKLLDPAKKLIKDQAFWRYQSESLALLIDKKKIRKFRLPNATNETSVVSDRFHLRPLISFLALNEVFYVLQLSQEEAKLYECSLNHIREVKLEEMPDSLSDALKYDDLEKRLQFHTKTTPRPHSVRRGVHHAHGLPDDYNKNRILRYLNKVDEGLQDYFGIETFPLILVGVDYILDIFEEASSYKNILKERVEGNHDETPLNKIHDLAVNIFKKHVKSEQKEALNQYSNLKSKGTTTDNLESIVVNAHSGNINILFCAKEKYIWGVYNPSTAKVHTHAKQKPESIDLIDLAAVQTILNGGMVYMLSENKIPSKTGVSALLRK